MNNNKVYKYNIEDTDKKITIEFYDDLKFDININSIKDEEYYNNVDKKAVSIEKEIENILGIGSIDKFNKKREELGLKRLTVDVELNILGCIFDAYFNSTIDNVENSVNKTMGNINNKVKEFGNREQRRNNNYRKNNYNKNYKKNYRRKY